MRQPFDPYDVKVNSNSNSNNNNKNKNKNKKDTHTLSAESPTDLCGKKQQKYKLTDIADFGATDFQQISSISSCCWSWIWSLPRHHAGKAYEIHDDGTPQMFTGSRVSQVNFPNPMAPSKKN